MLPNAWDPSSQIALNPLATVWVLLAAFLVFIMVPGIGLLEAGLTRGKNVNHALMKSLTAVGVMSFAFVLVSFSVAFSPQTLGGFLGNPARFALGSGIFSLWPVAFGADGAASAGVPTAAYLIFQTMFAAVTLALVGAGVPERLRFSAWLLFSLFFSFIVWPVVAQWVWSPHGFLANLGNYWGIAPGIGMRDFAGGTVVHAQAGFAGLAVTLALGVSLKRFTSFKTNGNGSKEGTELPEHLFRREAGERYGYNIPLAIIGTALLWFGWFGFNAGSTLDVTLASASAVVATNAAASLGGLVALLLVKIREGRYDPVVAISGVIGGLVMITPNAGYVDPMGGSVLGVMAGLLTYFGMRFMDRYVYHVDDPIGGFPCHGMNGVVGSLVVPLFANPAVARISGIAVPGLLYGGGGEALTWLLIQAIGVVMAIGFVFGACFAFIRLLALAMPVRATMAEEIEGLDLTDHGIPAEALPPMLCPGPEVRLRDGALDLAPLG